MATATRTPRKAGPPRADKRATGTTIAPERIDDPKAERVLWDIADQLEGLKADDWIKGEQIENPIKFPEGMVLDIDKYRSTRPIKLHIYERDGRTIGKGIEFWMNERQLFDSAGKLGTTPVGAIDHGSITGLGDAADHTWAALVDGTRDITGLQTFTAGIATDTIAERTPAAGVTADGVLLKDGGATLTENLAITVLKTIDGRDVSVDGTKLDGIEVGATGDQTAAEILAALITVDGAGSLLDADLLDGLSSLAFLKADGTVASTGLQTFNSGIATDTVAEKTLAAGVTVDGVLLKDGGATLTENLIITALKTIDGRDVSVDGTKLDGIEVGATADQTAAEILAALITVDGAGSLLDADLLDGLSSLAFLKADGTVASTGLQEFQAGIDLPNNKYLTGDNAGGTPQNLIGVTVGGLIALGPSGIFTIDPTALAGTLALSSAELLTLTGTLMVEAPSGIASSVSTTSAPDFVVGSLTGAASYCAIGLQGSLAFATGAVAQANLYSSATDTILYINNRLNSNISFRINNVDSFLIRGTNRTVSFLEPVDLTASNPTITFHDNASTVANKRWSIRASTDQFQGLALSDDGSSNNVWLRVDRTSVTIDSIKLESNGSVSFIGGGVERFTVTSAGLWRAAADTITLTDQSGNLYQAGVLVTSTAAELNLLDGVTATAAELNIMDGVTLTAAQINKAAIKDEANVFTALQDFDASLRLKSSAGGYATLQNALTATNRAITMPNADTPLAGLTVGTTQIFTGGMAFDVDMQLRAAGAGNYAVLTRGVDVAKTITLPSATATLPGLGLANVFTADQEISSAAPTLKFTDTTPGSHSWNVFVDGNRLQFKNTTSNIRFAEFAAGGQFMLYTAATGAFASQITSVATADSAITLPDATTTLAGLAVAQAFTALQDFDASLRIRAAGAGNYTTLARGVDATKTITLPSATSTLPGLELANTFSAINTFSATPLFTSGAITIQGSEAPLINFNATTGNDYQISGGGSLFVYNNTTADKPQQWNDNGTVSIGDVDNVTELLVSPGSGINVQNGMTTAGDIDAAGGFRQVMSFSANVTALQSAVYLKAGDGSLSITHHVTSRAGSVVGLTAAIAPALPVGEAITLQIRIAGVASGTLVCTGNGSVTSFRATPFAKDTVGKIFSTSVALEIEISANTANQAEDVLGDLWIES